MLSDLSILQFTLVEGVPAGPAQSLGVSVFGSDGKMDAAAKPDIAMEAEDLRLRALMVAAQDGDRAAYETLLRDCLPRIRRMVQRRGIGPELIDDVIQDVLLTVHRARQTYDPSRPFAVWLAMIADRRAIDALRRRRRHVMHEVSVPDVYESHPDERDGTTPFETGSAMDRVRGLIAELPAAQREAVERLSLNQQSLQEAARDSGRTVGALKVNFHRGLKALRALLDPEVRP